MYKRVLLDFYNKIENYSDLEYFIATLKFVLAPTIENHKAGTMLNLKNSHRNLKDLWVENKIFLHDVLDVDYFELRESKDSVLVLFYKKKRLQKKLKEEKVKKFLNFVGYDKCKDLSDFLNLLKFRFSAECPDEVGIFLGYPLKDVFDFKFNNNKKAKCVGYWKCFNNEHNSKRAFEKYDNLKMLKINEIVGSN